MGDEVLFIFMLGGLIRCLLDILGEGLVRCYCLAAFVGAASLLLFRKKIKTNKSYFCKIEEKNVYDFFIWLMLLVLCKKKLFKRQHVLNLQ